MMTVCWTAVFDKRPQCIDMLGYVKKWEKTERKKGSETRE
jgi:hypothetical protein